MRWLVASILGACLVAACLPAKRADQPRPRAPAARNATCASCHAKEAAEWRGSFHQRAYVDQAFQNALAVEPKPFCRGCHAPESAPDLGVGCVSCHIAGDETHPARRAVECAGCHEFRFPGATSDGDEDYMQTTAREHAGSASAGMTCASCHMPKGSHTFADVRDPTWLAARLQVDAELIGEDAARLTIAQTMPGHAFPTGDLFRRLEVGWTEKDAHGVVVRRAARHLARHFEMVPGRPGRQLVDDDRVFDEPRSVEMRLMPRSRTVEWWVKLQRVAQVGTGGDPAEATIESEVPLHSGVLSRP